MKRRRRTRFATLVQLWTRLYTHGLPDEIRRRRRAEIESDLWESLHDPGCTDATGMEILIRCARGIPSDLSWRLEYASIGGFMWKKVALVSIATIVAMVMVMVWMHIPSTGLQLPRLPDEPVPNYIARRRVPPPPPPPPPTWEEFVAKVNGRPPQKPGR